MSTDALAALEAEHEARQGTRLSLEADLDAAKRRLAEVEGELLTETGEALSKALGRRRADEDLVGVLVRRIALAEAARIVSANLASDERRAVEGRAVAAAAPVIQKATDAAKAALEVAFHDLGRAISAHTEAVARCEFHNSRAAAFGVETVTVTSTRAVLEPLEDASGLFLSNPKPQAPRTYVIAV